MDSVLSDILATCLPGVVLVALSLVAAEIGYRIGRRLKAGADDAMRSEIYTLQSAMLALFALLLGFSFAMGASAYANRRRVILDETLVLAKAHKRTDLLPEPTRSEVRERLIHYIDTRLDLSTRGQPESPWCAQSCTNRSAYSTRSGSERWRSRSQNRSRYRLGSRSKR